MKEYISEGAGSFILSMLMLLVKRWDVGEASLLFSSVYGAAWAAVWLALPAAKGFNPILLLSDFLGRQTAELPGFALYRLGAQVGGALVGALLAIFAIRCVGIVSGEGSYESLFCTALLEGMGALVVSFVYLQMRTSDKEHLTAPVIGLAAFAAAAAVGARIPALFNPALYLCLVLKGDLGWDGWAGLTVGALVGTAAGASLFLLGQPSRRGSL
jgi:hypothetical protein